jgi:hypothetical protein
MCVKDIIEALSKVKDKDKEVIVFAKGSEYPTLQVYAYDDISVVELGCGFDRLSNEEEV